MNTSIDSDMVSATLTDYASFGKRLIAILIDGVLLFAVNFVIGLILPSAILGTIISLGLGIAYFAYFESSEKQATIGKSAMGIKVIDTEGGRLSVTKAALRYIGRIVSACTFFIGFLIMLFTEKKQTLHDMIASSLVVNA